MWRALKQKLLLLLTLHVRPFEHVGVAAMTCDQSEGRIKVSVRLMVRVRVRVRVRGPAKG